MSGRPLPPSCRRRHRRRRRGRRASRAGPSPGAGQRAGAGAHQRERGELGAGRGQHGLAADQPAVGVPDQVSRAGRVHDREDVRAEGGRRVAARLVGARCLELAAHVDRDHVPAVVGQQVQDGEEVFLAAGVAGDEQGGVPLAHPGRGRRLQGRERAAGGADGGTPNPVRQLEGGWSAHSGEPYLATLNRTSASAQQSPEPWSGGLAAGFLGLISAPGGRPPPAAQPRGLRCRSWPRRPAPERPASAAAAAIPPCRPRGPPGSGGAAARPCRLPGRRPSPVLFRVRPPEPRPPEPVTGAPARGPAPGRADPAGLADVLDGLGLKPGPVPHRAGERPGGLARDVQSV